MRGRTTLASLAGSALAVVSAGVLVAFSLTAQRAALDAGVAGRPSLGRPEARTGDQIQPIRLAELPDERSSGETSPGATAAGVARATEPGSVAAVIETVLEATIPGDGRLAEAPSNRAGRGANSNDSTERDFPTFGDASSPALRQEVELRSSDIVAAFAPPPSDEPTGPTGPTGSGNAGGNGEAGNDPDGGAGPEEEEGPNASPKPKRDKKPKKDAKPEKEKKDKKPKDEKRSDKPEKPRDKPGGHGHDDDGHQGNGHEDHGNGNGNGHDEDGGQGDGDDDS